MTRYALVVGGTSGLGLEIGRQLANEYDYHVTAVGSRDPEDTGLHQINVIPLQRGMKIGQHLLWLYSDDPKPKEFDLFVYAAGFRQDGRIDQLGEDEIMRTVNVGLLAPSAFLRRLIVQEKGLPGFIAVTSTSASVPREREPLYCATKAALEMLTHSVSLDSRVGKSMVLAPSGMNTKFWAGDDRDTSGYLDPKWVAAQALRQFHTDFKYKQVKVLRNPSRVEIVETR